MYNYKTNKIENIEFKSDDEKFQYYDILNNITYYNIMNCFSNKKIRFTKFNPNNKLHKYFCQVAFIAATMNDKKIYLPINPIKSLIYIVKNYGWKNLTYFTFSKKGIITSLDIDTVLNYEAEHNDVPVSMFEDIYDNYYER